MWVSLAGAAEPPMVSDISLGVDLVAARIEDHGLAAMDDEVLVGLHHLTVPEVLQEHVAVHSALEEHCGRH